MVNSPISTLTAMASSAPDRPPLAERFFRNERAIVITSVTALASLACAWIAMGSDLHGSGRMVRMAPARSASLLILVTMWWAMMAAMMLPSAVPAVLLYGRIRKGNGESAAIASSWIFLTGYLLLWLGVSLIATATQLAASRAGLIDAATMRTTSP